MSSHYVVHMKDEGNGSYYLTEDESLFRKAEAESHREDEDLMEFMNENGDEFEIVYSLNGVTVIESIEGYFY